MYAQSTAQRRLVLQALLAITGLAGLVFFLINLQRGSLGLAFAELAMGVGSVLLLPVVCRTTRLRFWTLVYLVPFFATLLLALTTPTASATMFVWALLPPILAHLLLGRWPGLVASVLVMGAAALIYLHRFAEHPALMEPAAIVNVVVYGLTILALSHAYEWSRERAGEALRQLAATDPLTGLANRGEFQRLFAHEHARAQRADEAFSLLLLDLDHFKAINDAHGHGGGDTTLKIVAAVVQANVRAVDWVCRLGGEEFAVLLPGAGGREAREVGERVRRAIEQAPIPYGDRTIRVTASLGLAELGPDGADLDRLYRVADARLYEGKAAGRNRLFDGGVEPRARGEAGNLVGIEDQR